MQIIGRKGLPPAGGRRIFGQEEAERDTERLYETTPPSWGAIFARWCEPKGASLPHLHSELNGLLLSLGTPSNASPLLVSEGGGEGNPVLYRAAEGELVGVLEVVTDGDPAGEGADTEVGDLLE